MREDLPSVTAAIVAFARGVASARPLTDPPLSDQAARTLLPSPVAWLVPRRSRVAQGVWRVASGGLVDQMALRSAAIDEALLGAMRAGVEQVIVLGAGLDARAYRLDGLGAARVFEVDHPASQRYKVKRLRSLRPRARELVHVAVDFTRDSLDDALSSAGHDPLAPSFWIWEGVTMYLPPEATRATLAVVGRRSCRGSSLAVTYMRTEPDSVPAPLRAALGVTLGVFGEPLRASYTPEEMAARLGEVGLVVRSDENSVDWARRFRGNRRLAAVFRSERLAVASVT